MYNKAIKNISICHSNMLIERESLKIYYVELHLGEVLFALLMLYLTACAVFMFFSIFINKPSNLAREYPVC